MVGIGLVESIVDVKTAHARTEVGGFGGPTLNPQIQFGDSRYSRKVKAALVDRLSGITQWRAFVGGNCFAVKGCPFSEPRYFISEIDA